MKRRDKKKQEYLLKAYLFPCIGQIRFFISKLPTCAGKTGAGRREGGEGKT